ncbi:MAG: response regulator transcription factor, partial [Chloroflexi bacterium]
MVKILIIEDEANIAQILRLYLEQANFTTLIASDGAAGLELHAREHPDLVILDLMLPALDGMEVCRRIRAWANTPILMLTARQSEEDRIEGLELGADDYLVKPFSPREVVSRVKAILRRTSPVAMHDAGAIHRASPAESAGYLAGAIHRTFPAESASANTGTVHGAPTDSGEE